MELDFPISYLFPTELSPSARSFRATTARDAITRFSPCTLCVVFRRHLACGSGSLETARAGVSPIPQRYQTGRVYVGRLQRDQSVLLRLLHFLRGIRMYHDSTMLENAKAMPRVAAIVLSI